MFSYPDHADRPELRLIRTACASGIPLMGTLELLPVCNLSCDFCYVNRPFPPRGILGTYCSPEAEALYASGSVSGPETAQEGPCLFRAQEGPRLFRAEDWLLLAEEMKQCGCLFLLLTGGEPFLYPRFLSLYAALREMGFVLTINTNGTLISPKAARFLGQLPPRRVNVSLYGTSNRTYAALCHVRNGFDRALSGIRLLQENGIDIRINCSAVRGNREEIPDIFALGHSMGIPVFAETYMLPDPVLALHRSSAGGVDRPLSPAWRLTP